MPPAAQWSYGESDGRGIAVEMIRREGSEWPGPAAIAERKVKHCPQRAGYDFLQRRHTPDPRDRRCEQPESNAQKHEFRDGYIQRSGHRRWVASRRRSVGLERRHATRSVRNNLL